MSYLTRVAQDWFEVSLNQEDQDILQDWLSDWNLFVDELRRHFGLLDLSQIRYSLVVILELIGVSEVQYKGVMMIDDGKYQ